MGVRDLSSLPVLIIVVLWELPDHMMIQTYCKELHYRVLDTSLAFQTHITNDLKIENLAEAIETEIVKSNRLEWGYLYGNLPEVNPFE